MCSTTYYIFLPLFSAPEPEAPTPPSDNFKIGDRVWVAGAKPGVIAFIGEAQFAPGEWAGVVLDQPVGKNDGSVAGVRYFQCEPKRGVFSRVAKLTHKPMDKDAVPETPAAKAAAAAAATAKMPAPKATPARKPATANGAPSSATTPRTSIGKPSGMSKSMTGSVSSLSTPVSTTKSSLAASTSNLAAAGKSNIKIGDRVLVSGSKAGVLRYIGTTDFAKGEWAGVELDEPLGKNDGTVAGKRWVLS